MTMDDADLIAAARGVRDKAHAPYSGFAVGAALIDEDGRLHVGCNVENASYPEGNCAETSAIAAMVAAGGRRIVAIAVCGGPVGSAPIADVSPCGGCRQRISEFADAETRILLDNGPDMKTLHVGMADLLPGAFSLRR